MRRPGSLPGRTTGNSEWNGEKRNAVRAHPAIRARRTPPGWAGGPRPEGPADPARKGRWTPPGGEGREVEGRPYSGFSKSMIWENSPNTMRERTLEICPFRKDEERVFPT